MLTKGPATDRRERAQLSVLDALALTLLILGALAWLWTSEWRFMLTGMGLTLAALLFSQAMERRRITPPAE